MAASIGIGEMTLWSDPLRALAETVRKETAFNKWRAQGRGSKPGYTWSEVDAARANGTLVLSGVVRDGSMCWRSGEAAGEQP